VLPSKWNQLAGLFPLKLEKNMKSVITLVFLTALTFFLSGVSNEVRADSCTGDTIGVTLFDAGNSYSPIGGGEVLSGASIWRAWTAVSFGIRL